MEFSYYYGTEADQFSFIRIPKIMLTDPTFSGLSLQAKVLYGLLLDRMGLSVKNQWFDKDNKVFIIYQISEIQEDMGYSKKKAMEFLTELETIGLVEKKKRGFGLPSILYVKNFIVQSSVTSRGAENDTSGNDEKGALIDDIPDQPDADNEKVVKNSGFEAENASESGKIINISLRGAEMVTSRGVDLGTSRSAHTVTSRGDETGTTEVPAREPLNNNTEYINNNLSNIESNLIVSEEDETEIWHEYKELIRRNLEIDYMYERYPLDHEMIDSICDLIVETLVSKNAMIVISSDRYPAELVKAKMLKLNSMHLEYVLDRLAANTTKVRNIKKYLLATLFNAPTTINGYYQAEVNHDMPQYARR